MTEVVTNTPILSDSCFRTRPNFELYLRSDANAGGNTVQQIQTHRRNRQMKFPTLQGKADVDSFQTSKNDTAFKRWNDEGDFRPLAPYRDYDNIVDPVSGFVSAGGDVDRNTSHKKINSLVQLNDVPQSSAPQQKHSDRLADEKAPPPLRRSNTYAPGAPSPWNGRKISDSWIKSQLGGWTSDHDPRKPSEEGTKWRAKIKHWLVQGQGANYYLTKNQRQHEVLANDHDESAFVPKPPSEQSKDGRDHLALKYMYSGSTQKSYEEVPWDTMLAPKTWDPVSTLEDRPDMISQKWTLKRYDPAAQEWQGAGRSWDWFQRRNGYYKTQPIVFCSSYPRSQQIPTYSGCIGGTNLEEIDNAQEKFAPLTVKRVNIPRYSETAHRPNIPGYEGCTLWQGVYSPANSSMLPKTAQSATTATVHRSLPITPNTSGYKKESKMSKMVTTVPPCNPYNSLNKLEEVLQNCV